MERVRSAAIFQRKLRSLSLNHKFIQLLFILCLTGSGGLALAQDSSHRGTPADSKTGQATASTYARDKIETVNMGNRNFSLAIPLARVGGRGSAAYTITLAYNSKVWTKRRDGNGVTNAGGAQGTYHNVFTAVYDAPDNNAYEPGLMRLGGGWTIVTAPGIKARTVGIDPLTSGCNFFNDDVGRIDCGSRYVLTKMWVRLPDGSEVELRDVVTQGAPALTVNRGDGYHPLVDRNRGQVWRSIDGSGVIFVRDLNDPVVPAAAELHFPSGWIFLGDGTRMRMANGLCEKIIDRNGNFIAFDSTGYVDSLGRQTLLSATGNTVTVTEKGYAGVPDRSVSINTNTIGNHLRADFQSLPRPFTTGDAHRDLQENYSQHTIQGSHTDLFLNSEGIVYYGSEHGEDIGARSAVTQLNLTDGRSVQFRYNPYGEVAEIVYPGGGLSQIDYGQTFENCEIQAPFLIGRGVTRRRTLTNGTSVDAVWLYEDIEDSFGGVSRPGILVQTRQNSESGPILSSEKHYFLALNAEYRPCNGLYTGTGNEKWENAKEFRTEVFDGSGTVVTERTWQQRTQVTWANDVGLGYNAYVQHHGQDQSPNDPRVVREDTIMADGKMGRVEYEYDQFNNITAIRESEFGAAGSPGPLVRETVRTYVSSINGYCYNNLNGLDSLCGGDLAGNLNAIIYQPHLLSSETINEVTPNGTRIVKAASEFGYDDYSPVGNRPAMSINSGMIKYDGSRFEPFSSINQPRGNVTEAKRWAGGSNYITASNQYDNAGNTIWTRDPNGNVSTFSFADNFGDGTNPDSGLAGPNGSTFGFVSLATNPLGQQSKLQYNYSLASITGTRDANGIVTLTGYDGIGRPVRVTLAYGLSEQSIAETTYPIAGSNTTTTSTQLDGTRWLSAKTVLDGFGRPTITWQAEDGQHASSASFTIRTITIYDALGRVERVSNPYRLGENEVYTATKYDTSGRVIEVKTPDNAKVTTAYDGTRTLVVDQAGRKRISQVDALGRLKEVWEVTASDDATEPISFPGYANVTAGYRTVYDYDTLDNLISVTQRIGASGTSQTRSFTYDSLKRLTSAINPESGPVSYQYDDNGSLLVKSDARGVSTHFDYDVLGRVQRRWYNGSSGINATTHNSPALPATVGTSEEVKYFYDAQSLPLGAPGFERGHSVGRLVATTYGGGSAGNYVGYDALGRVLRNIQKTGGINYQTTAVYNLAGALISLSYPSGHTTTNTYDGSGRLSSFTGYLGDGAPRTYATGISYSPFGGVTQEQFGTTTPTYNKRHYNVRGQLYDVRVSTASLTGNEWNWNRGAIVNWYDSTSGFPETNYASGTDNNGNLLRQEVSVPDNDQTSSYSFTRQNYTYDSLNRLTSVAEFANGSTQSFLQSYAYDRFGNRRIDAANNKTWGGVNAIQTTVDSANNRMYAPNDPNHNYIDYDAAGNQTKDYLTSNGTRVYDAENRLKSATDSNNTTSTYTYDGESRRVKRTISNTEIWQVYGIGGELLAEYAANAPSTNPRKEYGYRNGELLITADAPENQAETFRASTDFSTVQGQKDWYYQNADGSSMSYVSANSWWLGSEQYNLLWSHGGHPGNNVDAVRQWRASKAGKIHITGSASDANIACGDGVVVSIRKGTTVLWQQTINNGHTEGFSYDLRVNVIAGDQINFIINARSENTCDGTNFDPAISYISTYQASTDFTSTQGQNNWHYLDSTGASMTCDPTSGHWQGSEQYALLWSSGGHPGSDTDAVRQWQASQAGAIRITGSVSDGNYACGDGVIVSIKKGTEVLWQQTLENGNTVGFAYEVTTTVAVGDQINFVINRRNNNICDSTNFDPTIVYTGSAAQVRWLVTDQLGTPRIILDESGSLAGVSRHDYLPFGEELYAGTGGRTTAKGYTASDNVRQKFTSKERDVEVGLDYFLARYYSSTQGRFTGADPLMIDEKKLFDPQRFNSYSYALNNPLKLIDPDGADPKEPRTVVVVMGGGFPSSGGSSNWERVEPYRNVDGLGESAIDAESSHIAQQIKNEFPTADVIFGGPYASDAIFKDLMANKPDHVIIYGYSMGGVAAVELANVLVKNGQTVDQLTTVDPVCKCQFSNFKIENTNGVKDAKNYYVAPFDNPVIGATNERVYATSGHREDREQPTLVDHQSADDITSRRVVERIRNKLKELNKKE